MKLDQENILIEKAKSDSKYFAPIYNRYYEVIFRFVYRKVQNMDIAGDITSQVFLKALLNLNKYQFKGFPFSSWLYKIALNETNLFFRVQSKHLEVSISDNHIQLIAEEIELDCSEQKKQQLVKALNQLKEEQQNLIEMRFFEQFSFLEIAQILNLTEAAAKMKVYRIVKRLKKMITLKSK